MLPMQDLIQTQKQTFQLGPFQIEHPFILAPMAGITNSPYRRLMRKMQSALMVSELISANGLVHASERTFRMLHFHNDERVLGIQIFGEDIQNLVAACKKIEEIGADFIDLNLGCPVPKIVKKGAGSAMCRNPQQLGRVLEAMVQSVKIPITIKIRTGWSDTEKNALENIRVAADAGVSWVAVHGRTRAQGYSGEADWDFIGNLKAKSSLPIIGNGDLSTPEKALKAYKTYGVDAVMIGRGALRNPFIFEQAKSLLETGHYFETKIDQYIDFMNQQQSLLEESFDSKMAVIHARKFIAWYAAGFPGCHEFRKKVFQIPESQTLWNDAKDFFSRRIHLRTNAFLNQPFLMGGHG